MDGLPRSVWPGLIKASADARAAGSASEEDLRGWRSFKFFENGTGGGPGGGENVISLWK